MSANGPDGNDIAENFTLDKACKIATCDKCKQKFDIDFYGDIKDHYKKHQPTWDDPIYDPFSENKT